MASIDRSDERCSIARSLEVIGQKWSLLIVREAFRGRTRFADIRTRLGVAPDVLTDRLARLVDAGILERRPYREAGEREREEYVLTDAGRALKPVLASIIEWGDEFRPVAGVEAERVTTPIMWIAAVLILVGVFAFLVVLFRWA